MTLFEELKKNVTDFTENVAKKSSTVIEIQKLKMHRSSLESDLRDCYVVLGKLYEKQLANACPKDSDEEKVMEKIATIRSTIIDIEENLRKIKGMVRCTGCGQMISKEFDFCPKCGAKVEKNNADAAQKDAKDTDTSDTFSEKDVHTASAEAKEKDFSSPEEAHSAKTWETEENTKTQECKKDEE